MKTLVFAIVASMVLPVASFAGETAKTTPKVAAAQPKQAPIEIALTGATKENRAEIEKLAKEAGAKHASFDMQTGVLKVSKSSQFNKDQFMKSLGEKLPSVT